MNYLIKEKWKDIKGYEGLYQISNCGRVKSLARKTKNQFGKCDRILKTSTDKYGYEFVSNIKPYKVHRIVALNFIPIPEHLKDISIDELQVNHIDENKLNNIFINLEWCTAKYNNSYGNRLKNVSNAQKNSPLKSKPVIQFDLDGNFIKEYPSIKECSRNGFQDVHIINCCKGKETQHKGFTFRYKKDVE